MPAHADKPPAVGWSGRNDGGLRGVRWFTTFVRWTGPWLGLWLVRVGTLFAVPFLPVRRAGSEIFFTHLRGRRANALTRFFDTYRNFLAFTLGWFERTYAFVKGPGFLRWTVSGERYLGEALAKKRGVILLTAHVGNFELAAWLLGRAETPVNVVMIDREAPAVQAFLEGLKGPRRPKIIAVNHSPLAALAILAALRRGEIVCMQGDRATSAGACAVPFLGRPAPFPTGPYALAQKSGAAVIPLFSQRQDDARYHMTLHPPLPVTRGDFLPALHAYVLLLEREVLLCPWYWFNLFDFWGRHAPDGGPEDTRERARPASLTAPAQQS